MHDLSSATVVTALTPATALRSGKAALMFVLVLRHTYLLPDMPRSIVGMPEAQLVMIYLSRWHPAPAPASHSDGLAGS
jgi:hypothetical protein